ncbi:uncharacterized protein LOC124817398 [Hydra vulgaris]|uniref:uncharacterized protein LOC124817398 n=1 Tax=Hydra vulgaris TaxID=6087 RepID=UPI001F5E3FC3|nr:uncharacterized protein LOC124817398 [Hydra vulgaris]
MIKTKKVLWIKCRKAKFRDQELEAKYKNIKNTTKKAIKNEIVKYEHTIAKNAKKYPKIVYQYMNNKTQIKDYIRAIENNNGIVITNLSEIANELNNFFSSVFTIEDKNLPEFPKQCVVLFPNPTIDIETVSKKLATLNVYKSTGVDIIHTRVLKECCKSVSKPLSIIFDRSFSSGIVPCLWLCANITPLFKKGDKLKVTNYRPVSLTSIVCKVMESIIRDTLMNHLTKNSILSDSQHGFVSSKSCCTNLLETFDIITQKIYL